MIKQLRRVGDTANTSGGMFSPEPCRKLKGSRGIPPEKGHCIASLDGYSSMIISGEKKNVSASLPLLKVFGTMMLSERLYAGHVLQRRRRRVANVMYYPATHLSYPATNDNSTNA